VAAGPLRIPLPPGTGVAEGAHVVAGVRPEGLRPAAGGAIEATVEVAERAGPERIWHVRAGERRLAVRPPEGAAARPGDAVRLAPDPAAVRLFDAGDGRAL
jgi:multiple sugar transport system ATP-binding protein